MVTAFADRRSFRACRRSNGRLTELPTDTRV